jgi:hypothetical protein
MMGGNKIPESYLPPPKHEELPYDLRVFLDRIVSWLRNGEKEFSDCDIAAHLIETEEHLK